MQHVVKRQTDCRLTNGYRAIGGAMPHPIEVRYTERRGLFTLLLTNGYRAFGGAMPHLMKVGYTERRGLFTLLLVVATSLVLLLSAGARATAKVRPPRPMTLMSLQSPLQS